MPAAEAASLIEEETASEVDKNLKRLIQVILDCGSGL
jgi:hypothetical protein